MAKYKDYKCYCEDYFGSWNVDSYLNKNIAEVCAKYKVSAKDFDTIANAFIEACQQAYFNGKDNAEAED